MSQGRSAREGDRKREGNKWKGRKSGEAGGNTLGAFVRVKSLQCVQSVWGKPRWRCFIDR